MSLGRHRALVGLATLCTLAGWPTAVLAWPFVDENPPAKIGKDRSVSLDLKEPAALAIVWDCGPTRNTRECHSVSYPIESAAEDRDSLTLRVRHPDWTPPRIGRIPLSGPRPPGRDPAIDQLYELRFRKTEAVLNGVPVVELRTEQIPGSEGHSVTLYRPADKRLGIAFEKPAALLGYYPGNMYVLFNPDMRHDVESWLQAMLARRCIKGSALNKDVPTLETMDNVLAVSMVTGRETCVFSELAKLPWVLDYSMRPIEYGPDPVMLRLPAGKFKPDENILTQLRQTTARALRSAFPRMTGDDVDITSTGSRTLKVTLLAPASRVKPSDPAFNGFWLKAQLELLVNINGDPKNGIFVDVYLTVSDGWLPKWRREGRPEQAHLAQAHLSPDSRRFGILSYVRDRIADAFVREFNATRLE